MRAGLPESQHKQGSAKYWLLFIHTQLQGYSCGQQLSGTMRQWTDGDGIARSFDTGRVQPAEVPTVVKRHLKGGCPVAAMLYPRFHQGLGVGIRERTKNLVLAGCYRFYDRRAANGQTQSAYR